MLALAGNSLRLYGYGVMTAAEQAVFLEVFHGFTFALPYACISVFCARIASEKTKGTLQSLILTVFLGAGVGSGNLIAGTLIDYVFDKDIQLYFMFYGMLMACIFLVLLFWDVSVMLLLSNGRGRVALVRAAENEADGESAGILQKKPKSGSTAGAKNKVGPKPDRSGEEGESILMNVSEK
jgi:MFS family permease